MRTQRLKGSDCNIFAFCPTATTQSDPNPVGFRLLLRLEGSLNFVVKFYGFHLFEELCRRLN